MELSGETTFPLIAGTALLGMFCFFIIFFVVLYRKAQLKFQLERQEFNEALLQTQVEIREQTLRDISRELHDNLGQIASLIKIHLNTINTPKDQKDSKKLNDSRNLLSKLIADIRAISTSLNSSKLQSISLIDMVQLDVDRINASGYLSVALDADDRELPVNGDQAIFLYRMFQEMINNILKHSRATNADVLLKMKDNKLQLKITDNGNGTDVDPVSTTGNGLSNIRERCRMIGAELSFKSKIGTGTEININLPVS